MSTYRARAEAEVSGMSEREFQAIEAQLAVALWRARDRGWLDEPKRGDAGQPEPVHPSPVYRELERLSGAP